MPIAFRCQHCSQLMSITRRLAGEMTVCPRCQQPTRIPLLTGEMPEEPAVGMPAAETNESPRPSREQPPAQPILASRERETEEEVPSLRIGRRAAELEELDLTPMVDVTFLLLIFFMVTASFSLQKSIETPPPDPDQQGAAQTVIRLDEVEEKAILIEIDQDNRILVEDQPLADPRDLPLRLSELRSQDQKTEVIISADPRSRHETLVTAVDAAQEIGMQRIRWGVRSED